MALKPQNRPALNTSQVLQVRKLYYLEDQSYKQIAEDFGTTPKAIEKAVQGIGKFYSSISDGIPESIKQDRMPARVKYSLASIKRHQAKAYTKIETRGGTLIKMPSYQSYMSGWSQETIDKHRQAEQEGYERTRKRMGF